MRNFGKYFLATHARLEPDAELRRSRTESYLAFVRAAKPMDPANPVLAPGDKERKVKIERQAAGIPLDDGDREPWLKALAAEIARDEAGGRSSVIGCSSLKRSSPSPSSAPASAPIAWPCISAACPRPSTRR